MVGPLLLNKLLQGWSYIFNLFLSGAVLVVELDNQQFFKLSNTLILKSIWNFLCKFLHSLPSIVCKIANINQVEILNPCAYFDCLANHKVIGNVYNWAPCVWLSWTISQNHLFIWWKIICWNSFRDWFCTPEGLQALMLLL